MATEHNLEEITELSHHMDQLIDGEVKFDQVTRMIYSTDASIYQIEPLGVVIPRSVEDVIATIEAAINFNVPVLFFVLILKIDCTQFTQFYGFLYAVNSGSHAGRGQI